MVVTRPGGSDLVGIDPGMFYIWGMVIYEVQQVIWVDTEHGLAQVLFLIDYGPHHNTVWVTASEVDGSIRHYDSTQVKITKNYTLEMNIKK